MGAPIDKKYITQVQWQMACCERTWCDWCLLSSAPSRAYAAHTSRRIHRDDAMITELETEVIAFLAEVDRKVDELTARYLTREAA